MKNKTKSFFNKFISNLFFSNSKRSKESKNLIGVDFTKNENSRFKEELKKYLGHLETKSALYDYQRTISHLYSAKEINFQQAIPKVEKIQEKDVIEKAEQEQEKIKSSFFNDYSIKLLEGMSSKNLLDLACKSYVGSTGMFYNLIFRHSKRP
jgi:hypothetical protein